MKSNVKPHLVLFLHKDHRIKCPPCFEAYKTLEGMKGNFKRRGISYEKIEDDSFQDIFKTEALPVLRIENKFPKHYSGPLEIRTQMQEFKSKYLNN
nr:hypothetical protein [uncultured archaeon]